MKNGEYKVSKVAKIYLPSKTATQSGLGRTKTWVLEFEKEKPEHKNQLMGWNSSANTMKQVIMKFNSCAEAKRYAQQHSIVYKVLNSSSHKFKKKSYADNFTNSNS